MRWIAVSIVVLAFVVLVIGWRATSHHRNPCAHTVGNLTCEYGK